MQRILFFTLFLFTSTFVQAQGAYQFLPPPGKTLLFIGQDKQTIDDYVKATGVIPAGVMVYTSIQDVSGLSEAFDNGAGVHHGAYLMEQYPNSALQIGLYMVDATDRVNQGLHEQNIDILAEWIRAQARPVYLRIGYEFDNPDNHYEPGSYIRAYQRIVNRFRELEVDNVVFVWHSGAYITEESDPMAWFPGDEYVDWIAASFFAPVQYESVGRLASMARLWKKPFMIAEASPMGTVSLEAKKDWYDKFFRTIADYEPSVACYINSHWDAQKMFKAERFGDARVQKFVPIKELWLKEISQERYVHAQKDL